MAGTISRGIKAPIIREGDNIAEIVVNSVLKAMEEDNFQLHERDIIAVTESVVARADGNYCTVDDIAKDIRFKFGDNATIGVLFPILSRNRFAICLKGIARGAKKVVVQLSYPADEVGNHLVDEDLFEKMVPNPTVNLLHEDTFEQLFGKPVHPFTGINYVDYYKEIIEAEGAEAEIIFSNRPTDIIWYASDVICCSIHNRDSVVAKLKAGGAHRALTLCDIMNNSHSMNGGCNEQYGLLGSNKASEEKLKLFPRNAQEVVNEIQALFWINTGIKIEAMVYGDGAFKDPVGKIWELADPVVSPAYTKGLEGLPNEVKIKYLADNDFKDLNGEKLNEAIRASIREKDKALKGKMVSEGTTPRRLTDLIGSLCDLTSGSGDKGTPIVVIQNYFNNYAD